MLKLSRWKAVAVLLLWGGLTLLLTGCPAAFNKAPIAIATAAPTSGEVPLTVTFDGTGSFDPDGTIASYHWDFGDGTEASTATAEHTYTAEGVYHAILTVTDNIGHVGTDKITITVLGGSIYFASDRAGGGYEIFRMDADGGNQAQVTVDPGADDLWPALLPSTRQEVAFASSRTGDFDIFKMTATGLLQTDLTPAQSGSNEIEPSWSPDGAKIAFASDQTGNWEIFIMDADGSDITQLTNQTPSIDVSPVISPDGTKIAFVSDRDGDFEIYMMNLDGTGLTQLTNNADHDGAAGPDPYGWGFGISTLSWSPDGSQIAFTSDRDGGDWDIFIMDADGTHVIQLTSSSADDYDPFWLPNGDEIVFVSDRDGGVPQIFKINVHTHAVVQLTTAGDNVTPARER